MFKVQYSPSQRTCELPTVSEVASTILIFSYLCHFNCEFIAKGKTLSSDLPQTPVQCTWPFWNYQIWCQTPNNVTMQCCQLQNPRQLLYNMQGEPRISMNVLCVSHKFTVQCKLFSFENSRYFAYAGHPVDYVFQPERYPAGIPKI